MTLVDQTARDRFATELNTNFCVSASAGAGKTRAIVDRVENWVRCALKEASPAHRVSRLVVVTYGELAARELKVRCRSRFLETKDVPEKRNQAASLLEEAFFGTIHSFCLKILREFGFQSGLPVTFHLLSDGDQGFFEKFKQSFDPGALPWPEGWMAQVFRYYRLEHCLELGRSMDANQREHYLNFQDRIQPVPDIRPLLEATPKTKQSAATMEQIQKELRQWQRDEADQSPFLHLPKIEKGGEAFIQLGDQVLGPYRHWLAEGLVVAAAHCSEAFRQFRLAERRLTYDDMIQQVRRLMSQPATLDAIRRQGWSILLDEAQDTDGDMFRILTECARPCGCPMDQWPREPGAPGPEAGRFSFVGDDQQSIYSQRADISQYLGYVNAFEAGRGGQRISFEVTMRCPPPVVREVNRIFPGRIRQTTAEFRKMEAAPWSDAVGAGVFRLCFDPDPDSGEDAFSRECRQVAERLAGIGTAGLGCASWSRVAVLCPRVAWLSEAGRWLERAGIPVAHQSSGLTAGEQPGSSWPYALMHVIAHPYDRFELIGVLRDIFGFRDDQLTQWHARDPSGLSVFSAPYADESGAAVLGWLQSGWERLTGTAQNPVPAPLALVCTTLFEECGLRDRLAAVGENPKCIDRFLQSAFEAGSSGRDLWSWLEGHRLKLEEKSPPLAQGEGVDLISCHKAKGLEWDVVVLLGLWRGLREPSPAYPIIARSGGGVTVMADKRAAASWKAGADTKRQELYQRLFYVAMTRARKCLLISDPGLESGKGSLAELIGWAEILEQLPREIPWSFSERENESVPPDRPKVESQAWRLKQRSLSAPRRILPHELAVHVEREKGTSGVDETAEETGVGGVAYGSLWHEWIEGLPWKKKREACRAYLQTYSEQLDAGMRESDSWSRLTEEAERLFQTPEFLELMNDAESFHPEWPFLWPKSGKEWMEGIMDLVVERGHCLWVIDWKTNRKGTSQSDQAFHQELIETYGGQLSAYRDFLLTRFPDRDIHAFIYATQTGRWLDALSIRKLHQDGYVGSDD